MKIDLRGVYVAPEIDVTLCSVEQGIAATGTTTGTISGEDLILGDEESW